ncbi:SDR family oxidoreductase [Egicoccus sp. AB-alg6-2]|uniref:SDR family oxidoreductase n=1 Tax=Egicoccus sp. AB-alg6-2 TaxID=3242692 RepID=UPI00359D45E2
MKVLIAGCGDLGTETGLRLLRDGHDVVGLRRRAERLPSGFERLAGDLGDALPPLPHDVDAVVFAAAPGQRSVSAYRRVYHDGLAGVLDGLQRAGASPQRVLFVSSTAVYGVDDGSWVDETTPTRPNSDTGRVLVEAEQLLFEAPLPGTVFRLAGIYGPGRTRLLDQVRAGEAVAPQPPVHTNRIHRDDAAEAIVHLLTRVADPAEVYLGVDEAPVDRGEVVRWLADQLGVPPPPEGAHQRSRGGDKRCRNDRLLATGFAFAYPTYREGYAAVLRGEGVRHP